MHIHPPATWSAVLTLLALASLGSAQVVPSATVPGEYAIHAPSGERFATFRTPELGGVAPSVQIDPYPDGWSRVRATWQLANPVSQDELAFEFSIDLSPDTSWIPHLAPITGTVVAQHVFRSPAIIAAQGAKTLSLVPDLEICGGRADAPWFLDYDWRLRKAWIGMSRTTIPAHVIYAKAPGMQVQSGTLELSFFAKAYDDLSIPRNPWGETSRFLWKTFGGVFLQGGHPHVVPMQKYVEQAYGWAFDRWEKVVWRESIDGSVGGAQLLVDYSQSPTNAVPPVAVRGSEIWNQAWYCNLRSASGMLRWATPRRDTDVIRRAMQCKELALSAPRTQGMFPSVAEIRRFVRANVFDQRDVNWTNSDRSPHELGIGRTWFHVLDASNTALWMLRWYRELEPDPRLLEYVRTYADWLLKRQDARGFFPAWLNPRTLEAAAVLSDSPETSRSAGMFLELFEITGDARYRQVGLRAITAVIRGPAQDGRWEDFETYWSDNFFGTATNIGRRFDRNQLYKQNTFSMFWTAEALLQAYRVTNRASYLGWGRRVLDELSMFQQVWQAPFMYVPTVGGFGVMNVDGEWNDSRQSLFAELFLDYYVETGESSYFERGVAALKASFAMMYSPLNPFTALQWQAAHPSLAPVDYGFQMENYGHWGSTAPNGDGMGFFSIFDWGCGAASEAFSRVTAHYGHVYIDRARGLGFGIDSVDVTRQGANWRLTDRAGAGPRRKIRVVFDDGTSRSLWLDGSAVVQ